MGLLKYEYRFSCIQSMVSKTSKEDMVKKEVAFLLNVLPKGTEFLDAVETARLDLFRSYTLTFGHPYFENGTILEVDRKLIVWEGMESAEQAEMFLGLRFIKPYPVNPMAHLDDVGAPVNHKFNVPDMRGKIIITLNKFLPKDY